MTSSPIPAAWRRQPSSLLGRAGTGRSAVPRDFPRDIRPSVPHHGHKVTVTEEPDVRFELECVTDSDGRLEGTVGWDDSGPVPFSGTLELLRLLLDNAPCRPIAPDPASGDKP